MDNRSYMEYLEALISEYPEISLTYLGESIMGRGIPMLTIGEGEKAYLYVSGQSGTDMVGSAILLRWVKEYASLYRGGRRIYRTRADYLYRTRTVYLVPMLNPDGAEYVRRGVGEDHLLYERLIGMNGGSADFSGWRANGRGVELSRNYGYGFTDRKREESERGILGGASCGYSGESSESEPEVGSLCNWIRYNEGLRMVLHLHEGDRSLRCVGALGSEPRTEGAENAFSRMIGIGSRGKEDPMTCFCAQEMGILGCSLGIGGASDRAELFSRYAEVRELLFCAPTMV